MNLKLDHHSWLLPFFLITILLSSCEIETEASGTVTNSETGAAVVGAHVMQVATNKKNGELVSETYTDALGEFYMDAGLSGFGAKKTTLLIIVEKDSFATVVLENNYSVLDIKLKPY